jgi:hypothetical protein
MAGSNPQVRESMRKRRRTEAMDGEPLNTQERIAQRNGDSVAVNIPRYAVQTLDIDSGDDLEIDTFRDGIFIRTTDD